MGWRRASTRRRPIAMLASVAGPGQRLVTRATPLATSLAAHSGVTPLVTAGRDGWRVSFSPVDPEEVGGVVDGTAVTYPGAVDGGDLTYRAYGDVVKELLT